MKSLIRCVRIGRIGLLVAAMIVSCTQASDTVRQLDMGGRIRPWTMERSHYCGLYCVYAGVQALGVEPRVSFEELIAPEFVGSTAGSSLDELELAAEKCGVQACGVANLSVEALRAATSPVLLHMPAINGRSPHWVLFLGVQDGKMRIVDFPDELKLFDFADFLTEFDGVGLILADGAPPLWKMRLPAYIKLSTLLVVMIGVVCATRYVFSRVRSTMDVFNHQRRDGNRNVSGRHWGAVECEFRRWTAEASTGD